MIFGRDGSIRVLAGGSRKHHFGSVTGDTDITQFVTMMERAKGLEPLPETWRATILPLNYTRTLFLPPREAFTNALFGPLQIEGTTSFIGKL